MLPANSEILHPALIRRREKKKYRPHFFFFSLPGGITWSWVGGRKAVSVCVCVCVRVFGQINGWSFWSPWAGGKAQAAVDILSSDCLAGRLT